MIIVTIHKCPKIITIVTAEISRRVFQFYENKMPGNKLLLAPRNIYLLKYLFIVSDHCDLMSTLCLFYSVVKFFSKTIHYDELYKCNSMRRVIDCSFKIMFNWHQ